MTPPAQVPEDERLRVLDEYAVEGTEIDPTLDDLVALAATVCEVPISLVSFIGAEWQWSGARVGTPAMRMPRNEAICANVVDAPHADLFAVEDARVDPRFAARSFVAGEPQVVFYAAAPLVAPGGAKIGTLCIIDHQPRRLTEIQKATLTRLAGLVTRHLHQRRARRVLANEAAWRATTDALPLLVSFVNADETYGLVNKGYEEWFGVTRDEIVGRKVREVIGEPAYAVLGPHVKRGLSGERFTFEQHDIPYRLGGRRDAKITFIPHHDANGQPSGYTALLDDITGRRRLEAERERLSRQRNEVLESMADAFLAVDVEWQVRLVNPHLEELFERSSHALVGQDLRRLVGDLVRDASDTTALVALLARCMSTREPVATTFADPEGQWLEARGYPTADGGMSVFFRDVTAGKNAEETALRQVAFERQLIGIVSHDLRNPLNVISMAAQLLQRQEELGPVSARHVLRIQNAGERANRLIRDLLDFTKARLGGGIVVERVPQDLHEFTRAVVEEIGAAHPDRELEVRAVGDGYGDWDADRLGQVLQNLVTNALKYSAPGSPVRVATSGGDDGTVTLTVHNEGAVIPAAAIPALFEPFERGALARDAATRSVGLGLYIVKHVVEAHRGRIEVRSAEGEGTTFVVTLPRHVPAPGSRPTLSR